MPSDGRLTAAAARATTGNVLAGTTATNAELQNAPGAIVAGDLILTSTGYWARVAVTPTTTSVAIDRWFKNGAPSWPADSAVPPVSGTYRCFPASCLLCGISGWKIKRFTGFMDAAATITIIGPVAAETHVIDNVAGVDVAAGLDFGDGLFVSGPFTVTPTAGAAGYLEFEQV